MKDHSCNSYSVSDHPLQRGLTVAQLQARYTHISVPVPKGPGTVHCDATRLNTVNFLSLWSAEC